MKKKRAPRVKLPFEKPDVIPSPSQELYLEISTPSQEEDIKKESPRMPEHTSYEVDFNIKTNTFNL
jgi:hypothetical protein